MARKLNAAAIESNRANHRDRNPSDRERIKRAVQDAADANRLSPKTYEVSPPPPARSGAKAIAKKPRVAYYCRVSTCEEQQAGSFESQIQYFRDKVRGTPEWEDAGPFSDEGIAYGQKSIGPRLASKIEF